MYTSKLSFEGRVVELIRIKKLLAIFVFVKKSYICIFIDLINGIDVK